MASEYNAKDQETGAASALIGILTPTAHEGKPWIQRITSQLLDLKARFVFIDPSSACFDPQDDSRLKGLAVLVNRVSDCGSGDLKLAKLTHAYILAAELCGVPVLNGPSAYGVGMAKMCHHALLHSCGLNTPKSFVVTTLEQVMDAAQRLSPPLLLKPNMAGFGAGIRRFPTIASLQKAISPVSESGTSGPTEQLDLGPDGVALIQEYIEAEGSYRVWVLGDRIQCAVHVATTSHPPVDTCQRTSGLQPDFNGCVLNMQKNTKASLTAFLPTPEVSREVLSVMKKCGASMGSVEFLIHPQTGSRLYYDVNMLSTLPDVGAVEQGAAIWGAGYDPWMEVCEYIIGRIPRRHSIPCSGVTC